MSCRHMFPTCEDRIHAAESVTPEGSDTCQSETHPLTILSGYGGRLMPSRGCHEHNKNEKSIVAIWHDNLRKKNVYSCLYFKFYIMPFIYGIKQQ